MTSEPKPPRRRPSPALIVATIALVVAASGTTYAAHRYLITSTGQIAPKVRSALRGQVGPRGPQGPPGVTGPAGPSAVKVITNAGPNSLPSGTKTILATADLSTPSAGAYLAIGTLQVDVLATSVTCVLATYGAAAPANDDATVNTTGIQRLTLQIPVVAASGGTYGATQSCTTGASASVSHEFVTLSAIRAGSLSSG